MSLSNAVPPFALETTLILIVGCGMIAHLVYKKYEVQPSSYFLSFLLLGALPAVCATSLAQHVSSFPVAYIFGFAIYYGSLLLSIITYRLSALHPLYKYPGPVLARVTKLWSVWAMRTGKYHKILRKLHEEYGPHIRIGPNELSIVDAELIQKIMGADGLPKGPMWDGRRNPDSPPSLIATRTIADHQQKRKPWNRAFTTAAVKNYGPIIEKRARQLADELESRVGGGAGGVVDLSEWLTFFAVDFMGDMVFGGGFELMRDGDVTGIWNLLEKRLAAIAWQQHIPWATRLLLKIPIFTKSIIKFRKFAIECVTQRSSKGSSIKDLFYHLNKEDGSDSPPSLHDLVVNGELAIVAGSDTTATVLSGAFYYLLTSVDDYERLRQEVDSAFPLGEGDPFDAGKLGEMSFLNAVLNETMRLQPPVMTMLQRAPESGMGGKCVGEHFLPEGTAVNVPPYILHRDVRYFSPNPDEFWPERWLLARDSEKSQVMLNEVAFIPFSWGPAACAGKNLALAEMRAVLAILVQRFHIRLGDGYDPKRWDSELEDLMVTRNGKLPVIISPRI